MSEQNDTNKAIGLTNGKAIGYIVGGGLKESLLARLLIPPQQAKEGSFVVTRSGDWKFYGLVTDIRLDSTDPRFANDNSETRLPSGLAAQLHGQTLFTNLEILSQLMLEAGPELDDPRQTEWFSSLEETPYPQPVKTVPSHHAPVFMAQAEDVAEIFGDPQDEDNFIIGSTPEQEHPICVNLKKFVQRSAGIFGATGSGKSFLTRMILAGLIRFNQSSVLVFDMHNEYGYDDTASDTNQKVAGLRSKFPQRVRIVGLGRGAGIRGNSPDYNLEIAESDIQPEDIEMLTRELNLKETTPTTLEALVNTLGRESWFRRFKEMKVGTMVEDENGKRVPAPDSVAFWANHAGVNVAAAEGLRSKMSRVFNKPYIVEKPASDVLQQIIQGLEAGQHIILSFGSFESDLDYLLVTNLLTRRIRETWEYHTNQFRSGKSKEPRPLVVVVEEAHKLLNREMAAQTTFSTIAREMRKYYVTLLIIDQRPSQIYDEVMSQLGTRICGWLGDESDIQAVLSGLAGRDALRGMLARLQPKEEALLLGWGVPMPILVHSRRYNDQFWKDLLGDEAKPRSSDDILKDMGVFD
jgi:hypothetical protein